MICNKHKNYKAFYTPKTACLECWEAYLKLHPLDILRCKDILLIVKAIKEE